MAGYKDFMEELATIMRPVDKAISNILLSKDRMSKHQPYSWRNETEDEHLHKSLRHILTYQIQRDKQQDNDEEDHLQLAMTRLAMALAQRGIE